MLTVTLKSGNVLNRHIGESLPSLVNEEILQIQADGDEKDAVNSVFPMLTPWNVRVAIFTQPFAELVYRNLRLSTFYTIS